MGNSVYASRLSIVVGFVLFALFIVSPSSAAAFWPGFPFSNNSNGNDGSSISAAAIQRLCDRQAALTGRLLRPLIDPDICNPPAPEEPTVTLTADPMTITVGGSSNLEWSSTNATTCEASNGWSGAKATSGNQDVTPANTTTYTLTCTGPGGSDTASATVTVNPVQPQTATLTLVKQVNLDDGGTAAAGAWTLLADGPTDLSGVSGSAAVTNASVNAGTYTLSESGGPSGYTPSEYGCVKNGGAAVSGNSITLAAGDTATCTITNDDQPGTLIVKKLVIRDNGGTAATSTFSFQVNDGTATAFEEDGQNDLSVDAGTYTITEVAVSGYTTSYDNCTSVVVSNGGTETCTVTNNDVAPAAGHLIVDKVTQPGGDPTEFTINASGTGTVTGGGAGTVTDATSKDYEVTPGTYSVTESAQDGWVQISNTCTDIVVAAGETENCTITNAKLPTLTVVKVVVNDNGGTKQVADFPLFIDGSPVVSWATTTVATGTRAVSETTDAGYARTFSDDCDSNGNVTLNYGDVKKCIMTNNDVAPSVNHLLISEVHYDPDVTHGADDNEWVEIHNPTTSAVDISFWTIKDFTASFDMIPGGTSIPAGGYLILTSSSTTPSFWSIPGGVQVISFEEAIGGGLNNDNESLFLRDVATTTIDSLSWGTNTDGFTSGSGAPDVLDGHSLFRSSLNVDTDTAADWADDATPAPGVAN